MKRYEVVEYEMEDYRADRDSITIEDVITELPNIARGHLGDYDLDGSADDFHRYHNQMIMSKAVEFLKEYQKSSK